MFNQLYNFLTGKNRTNKDLVYDVLRDTESELNTFLNDIGYENNREIENKFSECFYVNAKNIPLISVFLTQAETYIEQFMTSYSPANISCIMTNDAQMRVTATWNGSKRDMVEEKELLSKYGARAFEEFYKNGKESELTFLMNCDNLIDIVHDAKIVSYDIWNNAQDALDQLMKYANKDNQYPNVCGYACKCIFAYICNLFGYNGEIAKQLGNEADYISAFNSQVNHNCQMLLEGKDIPYIVIGSRMMYPDVTKQILDIWRRDTEQISKVLRNDLFAKKDKMIATTTCIAIDASFYKKTDRIKENADKILENAQVNMTLTNPDADYNMIRVVADDKTKRFIKTTLAEKGLALIHYDMLIPYGPKFTRLNKYFPDIEIIDHMEIAIYNRRAESPLL